MSRHDTGTKSFSFERVLWEIQRAFYSFKNSPVLAGWFSIMTTGFV